jgi:short-subunit dehydrogenase
MPASHKRTVLVTGASGGIGLALAQEFAAAGYDLVLTARSEDKLRAAAQDLEKRFQVKATAIAADLELAETPRALVDELRRRGLTIDALVNNAGFGLQGEFVKQPLERVLQMIQLNVSALTALSGLLLPGMVERGRGEVLNLASTAGFQPGPLMAVYYATKAYVLSFTEAIANELAGTGVVVTALCPGATQSGFSSSARMGGSRLFARGVMDPAEVARVGFRALKRGQPVVIPGTMNKMLTASVRFAPRGVVTAIARRMQEPTGG